MGRLLDKTGMTLEQASKRLGVSVALVRHAAAGRRNVSDSMREKIRQVFALGGSKTDVEMAGYGTPQERNAVASILSDQVLALVHATENMGDKGAAVVAEISAALDAVRARHKLAERVENVFAAGAKTTEEKISRRDLDAYFTRRGIPFPPEWRKVCERIPPDEMLVARRCERLKWFPPRANPKGLGLVTMGRLFAFDATIYRNGKRLCSFPGERWEARGVRKD